jgi:hypothetical protein
MLFVPKAMHGAFRRATVQLTSPTNRLLSNIVRVEEMFPLISVAQARPAYVKSAKRTGAQQMDVFKIFIEASFLHQDLRVGFLAANSVQPTDSVGAVFNFFTRD